MSMDVKFVFKGKIKKESIPKILENIYFNYDGYFSNFDKIAKVPHGFNKSNFNVEEIPIKDNAFSGLFLDNFSELFEICLLMQNLGFLNISNRISKEEIIFEFGIDEGSFNEEMYNEMLKFAEAILKHTPFEGFIFEVDILSFKDISYWGICDKSKELILEKLNANILNQGISISKEDLIKEIEENTNGFEKFAEDYVFVSFIKFDNDRGGKDKFFELLKQKYGDKNEK